jgi:uncharacterized membrane protein YraQ (UPF0718 family)
MIGDAIVLLVELLLLFLVVAFVIELGRRRFGPDRIRRWMGGPPVLSALKGIAIGFVTPFCTYSAIPMLIGLRRAGVPPAGYVAFLTAAPVLDPVLFGALALIVGLPVAIVYSVVAFGAAMILALTAQRMGIEHLLKTPDAHPAPGSGLEPRSWQGWTAEAAAASRHSAGLLRSIGVLLVIGVLVGLVIESAVSPSDVAAVTGGNAAWSIPIAAALGTPLYFSTSLFVPIAHSLGRAGLGIGAVVALTISGAGANIPEFVILTRLAAARLIAVFCLYVFGVALVGGLIAQAMFG